MIEQRALCHQDGIDSDWFTADGVGSVRSSASYGRAGGWWFLPAWLPDTEEHDIGPFCTKTLVLQEAGHLAADNERQTRT